MKYKLSETSVKMLLNMQGACFQKQTFNSVNKSKHLILAFKVR